MAHTIDIKQKVVDLSKTLFSRRQNHSGAAESDPVDRAEAPSKEETTMSADFDKLQEIVSSARAFYEKERPRLEATAMRKFVCVNATTGDYVVGNSVREVHDAFDRRFGSGVPSWVTQVGNPNHVRSGARLLQ